MPKHFWSPDKIDFIKKHLHWSDWSLSQHFGCTRIAVKSIRKKYGLSRHQRRAFSPAEDAVLISLYPNTRTDIIAQKLNRKKFSVYGRAKHLGLKKSPEFLESPESGRVMLKGSQLGKAYQFKKGHVPANKGKKMNPELKKRIQHTFFKKGHVPANTLEDGAITTRTDSKTGIKYKYIRIAKAKWVDLKKHMWEQANGEIPKGLNIVFKQGFHGQYQLENFELISNAELMQRNTLYQYPVELQQVIRLNNKLKNKINGRH